MTNDIRLWRWSPEDQAALAKSAIADLPQRISAGERAEALWRLRRRRSEIFASAGGLFHEAGWDLLLLAFVAHSRGERAGLGELIGIAEASKSVGLRWVKALAQLDLIALVGEGQDAEIVITDGGIAQMHRYLDQV